MDETPPLGHPLPTDPDARISSPYGVRTHPQTGIVSGHFGVDYAADTGTPIGAVADGVVMFVGRQVYTRADGTTGGAGNYVIVRHGDEGVGFSYSAYFHLQDGSTRVAVDDTVSRGDVLGGVGATGGATGPHLHFEYFEGGDEGAIRDGRIGSSGARRLDPADYLGQPFLDRITIRQGDQNAAVEALQKTLVERGLLASEGVDGDFGPTTRTAVEALQRQLGVAVDGIVGDGTRTAVGRGPETSDPPAPPTPPTPGDKPALDTTGPFAAVSVSDLVGVPGGTPLGALDAGQSYALARAVFGDGPGAAALQALDQHYGQGDGTLVRREIALGLHEGALHVGRENSDPRSGYNIGTFQIGGARSTPDVTRARYAGLVNDGVDLYERISGQTVDREALSVADRDVFAHIGHIVEKGRISATSTPDRHFERLADPTLTGSDLARFMSREIQVGVAAIGESVVRFTDPGRGVGIDLAAVAARGAEPDATRSEPALPVLRQRNAPDYSKAVEEWQRTLAAAGYDVGDAGPDGAFGPDTDAATRRAQRDASLTADGVVGGDTWAAYVEHRAQVIDGPPPTDDPTPGAPPSTDPTTDPPSGAADPVSVGFLQQLDAHAANLLDRYTDDPDRVVTALNQAARQDGIDRSGVEAVLTAADPDARALSDVDAEALTRALNTRAIHAARDPAAAAVVDAQRESGAETPDPTGSSFDDTRSRGDGAVRDTDAPVLTV